MFGRKLKINKNYGYIYKCIEDLKENIENSTNDFLDKALNLSTYAVLTDFLSITNTFDDNYIETVLSVLEKELIEITSHTFGTQQEYQKTVDTFYEEIYELLAGPYLKNKSVEKEIKISSKEQFNLLKDYYKTTDERLKKIFLRYNRKNRIFSMPLPTKEDILDDSDNLGACIANHLTNEPFVFIKKDINQIALMMNVAHEFGHVLDITTYSEKHTTKETAIYSFGSPYGEVNSIYQEYAFYEYLLNNNIFDSTLIDIVRGETIEKYLMPFTFASSLENKDKYRLFDMVSDNYINSISSDKYLSENLMNYGYGMMIAFAMLDNHDMYDKFQRIRGPYFDKELLEESGFTDETISKVMVKKMNEYFGGQDDKIKRRL